MSVNQLSTNDSQQEEEDDEEEEPKEAILPDRIRLYSSYDRPFFEDISSNNPVLYIIHNLLTDKECDALISKVEKKENKDIKQTLLEGGVENSLYNNDEDSIFYLWSGNVVRNHMNKEIDDRIEHSTGFTRDNLSDFKIIKHTPTNKQKSSTSNLHYDIGNPNINIPLATITIFLNDDSDDDDIEIIYPKTNIKIKSKKGMAIVHHNFITSDDNEENIDYKTTNQIIYKNNNKNIYIAKRYFYKNTLSITSLILLPILSLPFGGILPRYIILLYNYIYDTFDYDSNYDIMMIFDYCIIGICIIFFIIFSFFNGGNKKNVVGVVGVGSKKKKKK